MEVDEKVEFNNNIRCIEMIPSTPMEALGLSLITT